MCYGCGFPIQKGNCATGKMASNPPPLSLLLRTKESVLKSQLQGAADAEQTFKTNFDAAFSNSIISADGKLVAVTDKEGVDIYDFAASTPVLVRRLPQANVSTVCFSPRGTFLLTWHRKKEDEANLLLWSTSDGAVKATWHQRSNAPELWPPLKWSGDESIAIRAGNDELHVYNGAFPSTDIIHRLRCPGVQSVWVSSNSGSAAPNPTLVAFAPRNKSKPGSAVIWAYPKVDAPSLARSLQADGARVEFSADGVYVLCELSTSASADSYYGDSRLFLMSRDGRLNVAIAHPKEGPVHDFAWNPASDSFAVIAGKSPPVAAIYSKTGSLLHNFGVQAFNTIRYAPNGKVVLFAGYGNMSGSMVFYDTASKKALGPSANAQCVVNSEWSPDSRYLLTGTTRPRLQVDNGYKVWDYHGRCLLHRPFEQLFTCTWQPLPKSSFPDRAPSPEPKGPAPVLSTPGANGSPSTVTSPPVAVKPVGAYRPPGARGGAGGGVVAAMMAERYTASTAAAAAGAAPSVLPVPRAVAVPLGAAPQQLSASQKKRLKAKAKKEKGGAGGDEDAEEEEAAPGSEAQELAAQHTSALMGDAITAEALAAAPAPAVASASSPSAPLSAQQRAEALLGPEDAKKQVKKLNKKLTEIHDLKAKIAAAGGDAVAAGLDESQQAKVASEQEIIDKIAKMQILAGET